MCQRIQKSIRLVAAHGRSKFSSSCSPIVRLVPSAIAVKPEIVLLDEPTSALDLSVQAQIIDLLKDLQAKYGLSYMFISHDLRVVKAIAHKIIVMHKGVIVEQGATSHIFDNPQNEYTRSLIAAAFME